MRYFYPLALLAAVVAAAAGCEGPVGGVTAGPGGASTVNGSIQVPAGEHSGSVGTVNGSIHIEDNAVVAEASTVNGSVDMGAHASADTVSTVNGGVTLGDGAHVTRSVSAVNGGMNLKSGADVGGAVENVNGDIRLTAAHVAGGLRTVQGDIDVTGPSRVEDGILVHRPSTSWFNFSFSSRKPRIVIGPGAVVQGELRFERDVELYVSDKATVGPIQGAKAIRFSGDNPPAG